MKGCVVLGIILMFAAGCDVTAPNEQQAVKQQNRTDTISALRNDSPNLSWSGKLDSMLLVAATAKQDTGLAELYFDIGQLYADNDFHKAKEYYLKAGNVSEKLDWNKGRYMYASGFSNMLYREGLVDSGLVVIRQAYELAMKENNERWIVRTSMNTGNGYFYKSWYETTLKYYQEALHILEKSGEDKETLIKLYDNSGVVYRIMGLPDKAIEYDQKALALFGDEEPLLKGTVLYNLATAYHLNNDEKTEYYFKEALRICEIHNNQYVKAAIYLGLGDIALHTDLKEAENYCRKALEITTEINNPNLGGLANLTLGLIDIFRVNLQQAERYCLTSLNMAQQIGYDEYQVNAHRQLAMIYAMKHDFGNCVKSMTQADSIERVMARVETLRSAEELEAKYETEKKELKISALETEKYLLEKEKRLTLWLGIVGGAVLLLALASLITRQRMIQQKMVRLEQEKQLIATQSVLDGETAERTRLARDLHDGLGSKLTGVRLHMQELRRGARLEYADVEQYEKAMDMLDDSVREMRRVSHNLMPDALNRFGLKAAVDDFCRGMSSQIVFNWYGAETRLDPKLELLVYRSIHELVNNALKYSGASQIMVQIMQEADSIAFTVQDDGCGFDPSSETKGAGLQNIRTRVASFGGNIQIDSKAGEGTEINIEIQK